MKHCLRCLWCVFIFNLCWFFLVLAEDAATVPTADTLENTSSNNVKNEEEKSTRSEGDDLIHNLEPSVDVAGDYNEKVEKNEESFNKQLFVEATSQNSGIANEITTSGQPVVVTLTDAATAELQQRAAIIPSQNGDPKNDEHHKTASSSPTSVANRTDNTRTDFQQHETPRTEPNSSLQTEAVLEDTLNTKANLTEEIPSFSEWAQKQLEQAEKNKEPSNASTQQHQHHLNGKQAKLRWKNYASLDCGAKVVASNPEAVSPSAILSPSRDEYKLNTCTSRIWFIVELCEAIQAKKIDLANFELFSSSPRDFLVSVSDRFPTREWSNVGHFTAKDERDVQSFDLQPHLFGKYIKVEVKSHYGSEHYCPISLFRVYGTSEFEVLQKEDPVHADRLEDDDDDDDDDESLDVENGDGSKNLFSSATDAVISMVKKAAEVLGNKGNHSNQTETSNATKVQVTPLVKLCTCPSHLVVCDNCTDSLFGEVYQLLSCNGELLARLVAVRRIGEAVLESGECKKFGFELSKSATRSRFHFVRFFFTERMVAAMCNTLAVLHNKVVLNISSSYSNQTLKELQGEEKIVNIETSEPRVIPTEVEEVEVTDALVLESVVDGTVTKSTCSTDVSYVSQIRPTKTLVSELNVKVSDGEAGAVDTSSRVVVVASTEAVQANVSAERGEEEHQEKVADVENVTESVEALEDPLEHLMNELNGDGQHLQNAQATTTSTPQAQKESVFLRLSNRIKALERNMSLSGQYLEELSKRYKKQVEEIQKLLDKTILSINDESRRKDEYNRQLEERLTVLTAAVESLVADRRSWSSTVYCVIVSSLVTLFIVSFCCKIPEPRSTPSTTSSTSLKMVEVKRRKSIDVVTHSLLPQQQKKRRRPSDQALKIVRCSTEENHTRKKKKKKQQMALTRSNSIGTLDEEGQGAKWGRQESAPATVPVDWVAAKHIEEIPFALEESEHSSLEPLSLLTEGMAKIAAPSFLKTATNSRSVRVNNGEVKNGTRKSASLDETNRKSASPTPSVNGSASVGGEGQDGTKKERKGLKKIFKKVF